MLVTQWQSMCEYWLPIPCPFAPKASWTTGCADIPPHSYTPYVHIPPKLPVSLSTRKEEYRPSSPWLVEFCISSLRPCLTLVSQEAEGVTMLHSPLTLALLWSLLLLSLEIPVSHYHTYQTQKQNIVCVLSDRKQLPGHLPLSVVAKFAARLLYPLFGETPVDWIVIS